MIKKLIDDDAEAKAIAQKYGCVESMIAEAEAKLPECLAAQVGVVICAKRSAPVDTIAGPFEFVFITYFAGFLEGKNGWGVFRWSDVHWDDLPQVCEEIETVEKQLLPQAVGEPAAQKKLEAHRNV
jgi:hypothetical protein